MFLKAIIMAFPDIVAPSLVMDDIFDLVGRTGVFLVPILRIKPLLVFHVHVFTCLEVDNCFVLFFLLGQNAEWWLFALVHFLGFAKNNLV